MNVNSLLALIPRHTECKVCRYPRHSNSFCETDINKLYRYGARHVREILIEDGVLILCILGKETADINQIMFTEILQIISEETRIVINDSCVARDETAIRLIDVLGNSLIIS